MSLKKIKEQLYRFLKDSPLERFHASSFLIFLKYGDMWSMHVFVRFLVFSSIHITVSVYLPQSQIDVLREIYNSTNGEHWSRCKWNLTELESNESSLSSFTECGLTIASHTSASTDSTNDLQTVIRFIFESTNNLNGTISGSVLSKLTDLEFFEVYDEPLLGGPFPDFCNLTTLEWVYIGANFNHVVPLCVGSMSSLREVMIKCIDEDCGLVFNDTIIDMWCENGNDIRYLYFENIDYRFGDVMYSILSFALCPIVCCSLCLY